MRVFPEWPYGRLGRCLQNVLEARVNQKCLWTITGRILIVTISGMDDHEVIRFAYTSKRSEPIYREDVTVAKIGEALDSIGFPPRTVAITSDNTEDSIVDLCG